MCGTILHCIPIEDVMLKTYKFCIKPTVEQEELLKLQFDASRYIFNRSLALKSYAYKRFGIKLGLKELKARLPKLKSRFSWLKDADSQVLQQSVINLDTAFKKFFTKFSRYPKFKSKRDKQSIQYPQRVVVNSETKQIYLPKVGWVNVILHRKLAEGKIKTVTISKTKTNKYFASILVDDGESPKDKILNITEAKVLGIDTGLIDIVYCSNGNKVSNPKYLKKYQHKIAALQRALARKTNKSSKRRALAKLQLAHAYEKLTNTRNDFLHKLSSTLVNENQVIGVETLSIKNLIKNRKLAKSFADSAIGSLYNMLEYKIERNGGYFIKIDRFFASTKLCSSCGNQKECMSLKERVYNCDNCKITLSRDYNAAINIKNETIKQLSATGHVVVRRGDTVRPQLVASAYEASRSLML